MSSTLIAPASARNAPSELSDEGPASVFIYNSKIGPQKPLRQLDISHAKVEYYKN
jgi:hypothetical protein